MNSRASYNHSNFTLGARVKTFVINAVLLIGAIATAYAITH